MVEHLPQGRGEVTDPANEPLLRHRLVVRFSDCDPLGHVNNAVYLTYLEQARIILWKQQIGLTWSKRVAEGLPRGEGFILARAEVDFRAQAHEGDELEVRLSLGRFGRTSATYDYEIEQTASGLIVAAAKTVQVWFDYERGIPVEISDELKEKLRQAGN
jgi:acyl-CoA thioester hydrolase